MNETIAPGAKEKQTVVRTAVDRGAVVDASPGEVTLLVHFEQQPEAKAVPAADSGVSSVRVTPQHEDGRWKVSKLDPV